MSHCGMNVNTFFIKTFAMRVFVNGNSKFEFELSLSQEANVSAA